VRRPLLAIAAGLLLALPAALAGFDGGYGDLARIVAGAVAALAVALAAVAAPAPLPRGTPARLALAGLAALFALTLASVTWAPLAAPAYADAQRVALYLAALTGAIAVVPLRVAVPALAASATGIVLAGLSERLAPWLVTLERSVSAGGRLAAPLGYWNAMGVVAAMGLVLCAGIAGERTAAPRLRAAAAACAPVLGAGLALTFSRGGLLAAAAGLVVVLLSRPDRAQLRACALTAAAATVAGVTAAALPAVGDLAAAESRRSGQGAALAAVIAVAAAGAWIVQRRTGDAAPAPLRLPGRRVLAVGALALVCAGVAAFAVGERTPRDPAFGATAQRLTTVESPRYDYWRVALDTFADHPLAGAGSSAFQVEWLRERTVAAAAHDAHSLPLETAAELGLAGLAALALLVAGVLAGCAALQHRAPGAAAAAFGALAAWAVHACVDWGWEMPSVSLIAVLLAGAVLGSAAPQRERQHGDRGRRLDREDHGGEALGAVAAGQQHRLQERRQGEDGQEGAPV